MLLWNISVGFIAQMLQYKASGNPVLPKPDHLLPHVHYVCLSCYCVPNNHPIYLLLKQEHGCNQKGCALFACSTLCFSENYICTQVGFWGTRNTTSRTKCRALLLWAVCIIARALDSSRARSRDSLLSLSFPSNSESLS